MDYKCKHKGCSKRSMDGFPFCEEHDSQHKVKSRSEDKLPMKRKAEEVDTKIYGDVILLTMLEIMGVEKFRAALSMALSRHASDSHLKTERKQASEFNNVISDLSYLGWQTNDFKM